MTTLLNLLDPVFFLNVIRGIFDSDGSFEAKIYLGVEKPVSFHMNIIFPQKDSSVIEMIMDKLGYPPGSYISQRVHQLESGNVTESSSKSIAFSNPAGQRLLSAWQENPPIAPTKFLDYQISLVLVQVNTISALEIVNSLCPGHNLQDLRIASFALMHLRFQMFGKVKENLNPNLIPIEDHYKTLKATPYEIEQATFFGDLLFKPIYDDFVHHINTISISDPAYFLGLHIGDGSFYFSTNFNEKGTSFKAAFAWNLSDCLENKALLEAVKVFLERNGIVFTNSALKKYKNSIQLCLTTKGEVQKFLLLFEKWRARDAFTNVRKNQFELFVQAMEYYESPSFRNDYEKCSKFIKIKWTMNSATNYKKKGTYETDMVLLERWYETTSSKRNNKNKKNKK